MAGRKPWESLSPAYRERLSKKGITPQMHSRGASIKAARGHEHTPERPGSNRQNKDYGDYYNRRRSLVNGVNRRKAQLWGEDHKYNAKRSRQIINIGKEGKNPPSNAQLQWALNATDEELMEKATSQDDEYSFLWYH